MSDYIAKGEYFGIKPGDHSGVWLYFMDSPLKHLSDQELGDLKLLLNTI